MVVCDAPSRSLDLYKPSKIDIYLKVTINTRLSLPTPIHDLRLRFLSPSDNKASFLNILVLDFNFYIEFTR